MEADLSRYLGIAAGAVGAWERKWGPFETHPSAVVPDGEFEAALERYLRRLGGNYPFFHPRYAGQMLKPPHPAAVVGYLAAMLINPNNHALDGGPPTSEMEKEVVEKLVRLFSFPSDSIGHLTSSGTIANLEALWIAREATGGKAVAYSSEAHYTHERMCGVIGLSGVRIPVTAEGEMGLEALEEEMKSGRIGTVVATAGTTGFGSVDDIPSILTLAEQYGVRVHVDAAYGGFFRLLAGPTSPLSEQVQTRLEAIARCDSVVVDPHKHGLQPYGCGAVLLRDPAVGRFYKHDSPYTYFTSDDLHLGEISLECSRAGAAAGALWLTFEMLPLKEESGLGSILAASIRAAQAFDERLRVGDVLRRYRPPMLDVVSYHPVGSTEAEIDQRSTDLFQRLMRDDADPIFLSLLKVAGTSLGVSSRKDSRDSVRILRSVLMKPEHESYAEVLVGRLEQETKAIIKSEVR